MMKKLLLIAALAASQMMGLLGADRGGIDLSVVCNVSNVPSDISFVSYPDFVLPVHLRAGASFVDMFESVARELGVDKAKLLVNFEKRPRGHTTFLGGYSVAKPPSEELWESVLNNPLGYYINFIFSFDDVSKKDIVKRLIKIMKQLRGSIWSQRPVLAEAESATYAKLSKFIIDWIDAVRSTRLAAIDDPVSYLEAVKMWLTIPHEAGLRLHFYSVQNPEAQRLVKVIKEVLDRNAPKLAAARDLAALREVLGEIRDAIKESVAAMPAASAAAPAASAAAPAARPAAAGAAVAEKLPAPIAAMNRANEALDVKRLHLKSLEELKGIVTIKLLLAAQAYVPAYVKGSAEPEYIVSRKEALPFLNGLIGQLKAIASTPANQIASTIRDFVEARPAETWDWHAKINQALLELREVIFSLQPPAGPAPTEPVLRHTGAVPPRTVKK